MKKQPIDTKALAEDCFALANEIHDIGYEHLIEQEIEEERKDNLRLCKRLNEKRLNSSCTYSRFKKLDLDALTRKLWDYSAQIKDEKYKIERDWNDPEHYLTMEAEYDLSDKKEGRPFDLSNAVKNKNSMAEGMWKMLEPTLPSNDAQHVSFMVYQRSRTQLLNGLRELQRRRVKSVLLHGGDKPYEVPEKGALEIKQDVASRKARLNRLKQARLNKNS